MRSDLLEFVLGASICTTPLMMFCMIFGVHGFGISRNYLNRRFWSDEPMAAPPQIQMDVAVFWEGLNPFLAAASILLSLLLLDAAPVPRGAWQLWPALAVGMAAATSTCAVLLSGSFDISYQRALVLQILFSLVVAWHFVLTVVAGLLLFGVAAGLTLLIGAMFGA